MINSKITLLIALAFSVVACNSSGNETPTPSEQQWTAISEWSAAHADFDTRSIPSKLTAFGVISATGEYTCRGGKLYYSDCASNNLHLVDGGLVNTVVSFSEDGTCRRYVAGYDGTMRYIEYNWRYDEASASVCTSEIGSEREMRAQVKAIGDGRIVLDGNLCGNADRSGYIEETGKIGIYSDYGVYVRMSFLALPEEAQREVFETAVCDNPL